MPNKQDLGGPQSFHPNRSASLGGADARGLVCEQNGWEMAAKVTSPGPGLAGISHRVLGGRPCSRHPPTAGPHPHPRSTTCPSTLDHVPVHACRRPATHLSPPVCAPFPATRAPPRLRPSRRNSFASLPTEPTVPVVNQELREILKIKSETTGCVQEGDDYPRIFPRRSCSILFVYFRGEMVL